MKFVYFQGTDSEYYSMIKALIETANSWIFSDKKVNASTEAHAVSMSKGNLSDIGVFSDTADKTI